MSGRVTAAQVNSFFDSFSKVLVAVLTASVVAIGVWVVQTHEMQIKHAVMLDNCQENMTKVREFIHSSSSFDEDDGDKLEDRVSILERLIGEIKGDVRETKVLLQHLMYDLNGSAPWNGGMRGPPPIVKPHTQELSVPKLATI